MREHQILCCFWRFWLKGLQIAAVGLADGFRDRDVNGTEKRSEALILSVAVERLERRRRGEEREQYR